MTCTDISHSPERDVIFTLALRQARQEFFEGLSKRAPRQVGLAAILGAEGEPGREGGRREQLWALAEFFFVIDSLGLNRDRERFERYLKNHETSVRRRLKEDPLCWKGGEENSLTGYGRRLEKSIFSDRQISMLWRGIAQRGHVFSLKYGDIGKLMSQVMGPDAIDLLLDSLCSSGLLKRHKEHGTLGYFVYSTGIIEQEFGSCLDRMRRAAWYPQQ